VAVASAGLYAMLTPFDLLQGLPPAGDTWVHLIPYRTHPQSSSLHGAVKAGSSFLTAHQHIIGYSVPKGWEPFRDREESSTSSLLLELQYSIHSITGSYTRTAATSAYVSLTVHRARSDAYHRNLTGWWPSQ